MTWQILTGDARAWLATLPAASVQTCVTSPPYFGLRDYGAPGQLGLELTPDAYVAALVAVFRDVRRVLRDDGTVWLNLGDSYASAPAGNSDATFTAKQASNGGSVIRRERSTVSPGIKPKDLIGIPWRVAFALQADGWYLRSDIIWHKPNPMPESVTDRPTKSHEYLFLLTKNAKYYYDAGSVAEPSIEFHARPGRQRFDPGGRSDPYIESVHWCGAAATRNKRSVWTVPTQPYPDAHFATYPEALIAPCILAGSRAGDLVLDPFTGSGTTGVVAIGAGRDFVGIELSPAYVALARRRLADVAPLFAQELAESDDRQVVAGGVR